jgi:Tfp pilus assembly protein PilO
LEHRGLSSSGAISLRAASARASHEVGVFKKERLVKGSELTMVLDGVFKAARRSGLKITSADYNPVTIKDTNVSRYLFSFPVQGRYRQIRRFIYDIENSEHMLVVESITMSSSKKSVGRLGVEVELSIYFI